jgi:shikimate kinase
MRQHNQLKIAFIGMSNTGKSKVTKVLNKGGLYRFEVDAAIGNKLTLRSITSVAEWLGYPDAPNFTEREAQYVALEDEATKEAIENLRAPSILDTTGSVIYVRDATLKALKKDWLIVNFRVNEKDIDELFTVFKKNPKPVIWNGMFDQHPGESREEALERCYPLLLRERLKRYNALADVTINRFALYKAKTPDSILDVIESAL